MRRPPPCSLPSPEAPHPPHCSLVRPVSQRCFIRLPACRAVSWHVTGESTLLPVPLPCPHAPRIRVPVPMSSPPSAPPPLTSPTRQNPKPGQSHPTPPPPSGLAVPPGQTCRPQVSTHPCTCRAHLLDIGLSSASTRPCLSLLLLRGLAGHGDGEFRRGFPKVAGRAGRPQGNGAAPPGGEGWRQEGARGAGMEPEGSRRSPPPAPTFQDLPLALSRGPGGRRPEGEGAGWGRLGGGL